MEWVYTVALVVGLGYGVLSTVLHGFHAVDHDTGLDGDGDHAAGHADSTAGPSPINGLTIAAFLLGFGALGLLGSQALGLAPLASGLFALIGALLVSLLFFATVLRTLYAMQGSSSIRGRDVLNAVAEVITSIPEAGVGEIALVVGGTRFQLPARAIDGRPLERGQRVVTVEVRSGVAHVASLPAEALVKRQEADR